MTTRIWGGIVSLALLAALASPLLHGEDSFPLSTFPMFSRARPPVVDIDHVVGIDASGHAEALPPSLVMKGEVLQTKVAIGQTIRRGREAVATLCAEVAERVADEEDDVVRVEVRSDRFQVAGYFTSRREPIRSSVHARCDVPSEP